MVEARLKLEFITYLCVSWIVSEVESRSVGRGELRWKKEEVARIKRMRGEDDLSEAFRFQTAEVPLDRPRRGRDLDLVG